MHDKGVSGVDGFYRFVGGRTTENPQVRWKRSGVFSDRVSRNKVEIWSDRRTILFRSSLHRNCPAQHLSIEGPEQRKGRNKHGGDKIDHGSASTGGASLLDETSNP